MKQDKFFDEEIIDMMNRMENQSANAETSSSKESVQESGIYAGVKILGKWISFERHQLLNQEISMMIPQNFVPMSPDIAKRKYPSEQRPETILTDETGTINLMFQYMEGKESDSSIENFRNKIFGMMKRVNPELKSRKWEQLICLKKHLHM